jgi:hypothetical protein
MTEKVPAETGRGERGRFNGTWTGERGRFNGTWTGPTGRPKGVPNRSTTAAREAIAAFAEANAPKLQAWLDDIAAKNPEKAAELFLRALEYHIPKLARTESIGENDGPASYSFQIAFVDQRGRELPAIEAQGRIEPAESLAHEHRIPEISFVVPVPETEVKCD